MSKLTKSMVHFLSAFLILGSAYVIAGYKARPWSLRSSSSYPAQLKSEGVTITVEPLFRNEMAAEVFDSKDMLTRGIMPIALGVFNENDYPVRVEAESIELISGEDHAHTMLPGEIVYRLFHQGGKKEWVSQPVPRDGGRVRLNPDALDDFNKKYLGTKTIGPRGSGGGFIFVHPPGAGSYDKQLSVARLFIPGVYREDTGKKMIFFEIDIKPSLTAESAK